jgi:hypothetical protein
MIELNNWSTTTRDEDPYTPPECKSTCLQGNVFGHPNFPDGDHVITSRIVSTNKRIITTYSGHQYRLGNIDPKFRRLLRKIRPEWNWRKPITAIK